MRFKDSSKTTAKTVQRNIEAVHRVRSEAAQSRRRDQVFVDKVTAFAGSTASLYAHILFYGSCILSYLCGPIFGFYIFRENLSTLGIVASLEALFLSVFVLINQKHMNALERRNSDLHLQMSMLAEHEVTKIAQLTDLIAKHLGVSTHSVADLETVKKDIDPQQILDQISTHEKNAPAE